MAIGIGITGTYEELGLPGRQSVGTKYRSSAQDYATR